MDITDIISKLNNHEIKFHELEEIVGVEAAPEVRRAYLKSHLGKEFKSISNFEFDLEEIHNKNCENVIGGISVPLGIAGPLRVNGENSNGEFFIPIATTEGALIASINRGCKVISLAGGATSIVEVKGISRAPIIKVQNISEAKKLKDWIRDNKEKLKDIAEATSSHIKLLDIKTYSNGKYVWVRINFDTEDAMGMNMAVFATQEIVKYLESNIKNIKIIALSGNVCVDKKPAAINIIEGRGKIVETEVSIPKALVEKYLKTSAEEMVEINKSKIWLGGHMSGSLGFNAHVANMIAGIFLATGQDIAHVVDASTSSINMSIEGDNLDVNLRIPALNIGTVGGGTQLSTQKECQDILMYDLTKQNNQEFNRTKRMAEIIGAAVLAGELSLHAAFSSNSFVCAHGNLGRKKCKITV
ncbi:hydroxymethylglutaryl-CoA reductase [Candidatus Dojkabacteria bacterium]|nr:hydroxymethylglutaryl-CoA reductase [Candidatus Dojkabacteria bacterium]